VLPGKIVFFSGRGTVIDPKNPKKTRKRTPKTPETRFFRRILKIACFFGFLGSAAEDWAKGERAGAL
jgi:hypothetical protein